ncbi:Ank2, partial [Symbiodinium natans]
DDLQAAEPHLSQHARILADNVLLPGAPLFVGYVVGRYDVAVHEVPEFMQPELEDWILVCTPKSSPAAASADLRELRQWGERVDEICWASSQDVVDWNSFQAELGPALRAWAARHGLQGPRRRVPGASELQAPSLPMSVRELRSWLKSRGVDSTGPKSALVRRFTALRGPS